VTIRRRKLFDDTVAFAASCSVSQLFAKWAIIILDDDDEHEGGIDQGGVMYSTLSEVWRVAKDQHFVSSQSCSCHYRLVLIVLFACLQCLEFREAPRRIPTYTAT
jgi:hypothetical protein